MTTFRRDATLVLASLLLGGLAWTATRAIAQDAGCEPDPVLGEGGAPTRAVSVAARGDVLVAPSRDGADQTPFFENNGGGWTLVSTLTANRLTPSGFGGSSATNGAGVSVVGAAGGGEGEAFIFERAAGDPWGAWQETTRLTANRLAPDGGASFGTSVAVSTDGELALVGSPRDGSGAVHVYQRACCGGWTLSPILTANDLVPTSDFGWSLGTSGELVVVGVPKGNDGVGRVDVYQRSGDALEPVTSLVPTSEVRGFGTTVSIDGDVIAVGSADDNGGAVFVYRRDAEGLFDGPVQFDGSDLTGLPDSTPASVVVSDGDVVVATVEADGYTVTRLERGFDGFYTPDVLGGGTGDLRGVGFSEGRVVIADTTGVSSLAVDACTIVNGPDADDDGIPDAFDGCPEIPSGRLDRNDDGCPDLVDVFPRLVDAVNDSLGQTLVTEDAGATRLRPATLEPRLSSFLDQIENSGCTVDEVIRYGAGSYTREAFTGTTGVEGSDTTSPMSAAIARIDKTFMGTFGSEEAGFVTSSYDSEGRLIADIGGDGRFFAARWTRIRGVRGLVVGATGTCAGAVIDARDPWLVEQLDALVVD